MSKNSRDSTTIVPDIKGSYNDTADAIIEIVENIFIPLISIDKTHNTDKCTYLGNLEDEVLQLSNFDKTETPVETVKFTMKTTVKLKIEQGNKDAELEEDSITCVSNQVKMVNVIHNGQTTECSQLGDNSSEFILDKVKYGDTFEIEIEPYELYENSYNDAYILFRYYSDLGVADCGKVRFTNTSKVGKRLVTNIEGLPLATTGQQLPWTREYVFGNANASFNIANKYQDPLGMCFAITIKRIEKAYQDLGTNDAITAKVGNSDYVVSGTISATINDAYFGYGVGGALAKNGYAELISHEEIWNGKLEEGASIQYWTNKQNVSWEKLKQSIRNSLNQIPDEGYFTGGHSVIFKSYKYNENGEIISIRYYDYHGVSTGQIFEKSGKRILLGANLKDEK